MTFPPTYDFPEDATVGDDVIFTDIHVNPVSLPAPAPEPIAVADNSVDEEEEDPEEDMNEEEEDPSEEENEPSGEPDNDMSDYEPQEATPFYYTPGGGRPRTMRTARKSVRFPSTDYASSSRARGPHNTRISTPTPSPVPSPAPSSPIISRSISSPSTTPLSVPPSPPFPGNTSTPVRVPPATSPHMHAAEWIEYWQSFQPTQGASTSAAPLPQTHGDRTISQLIGRAYEFDLRILQLEHNIEILPGPAQLEDLDDQVQDMDERVNNLEHRAYQMNDRVLARGALADQFQTVQTRLRAVETERDILSSRISYLERHIFGLHHARR